MRVQVTTLNVTLYALDGTQDSRQGAKETEQIRMAAVALIGVVPVKPVQTEEELDVAHGVSLRAEHVAKEEIAKLHNWEEGCGEEAAQGFRKPFARAGIQETRHRCEEDDDRDLDGS